MDLEKTARYIAQLSGRGYKYAVVGKLRRYNKEIFKRIEYDGFEFYLCRLSTKREVISYCLPRSEGSFRVFCLASKPLEFPNAPLKLWYDEGAQRLKLIAQRSFINECLNLIEEASSKKYPNVKLYTAYVNEVLRKLYSILAYTYNEKERVRAVRKKVRRFYVEALKRYGIKPREAMREYKQYVIDFREYLRRVKGIDK